MLVPLTSLPSHAVPANAAPAIGTLDGAIAALQPALAHAQARVTEQTLPRWFADGAACDCTEILGLDGTVVYASGGAALELAPPGLAEQMPGFWLRRGSADARQALAAAAAGYSVRFVAAAPTRAGLPTRWDVAMAPLCDGDGATAAVLVVTRDMAGAPGALGRQAALASLTEQARHAADMAELASLSATMVGSALGVSCAGYAATGPASLRRDWNDGRGIARPPVLGAVLARLVDGPVMEPDLATADWLAPDSRARFAALGPRGMLAVPVSQAGAPLAVLFAATTLPRAWSTDERHFLLDAAERIGFAAERLAVATADPAALRSVVDVLPALIAIVDSGLVYQFVNAASADWLGRPPAAIIGQTLIDVLGVEGMAWRQPFLQAALAGRPVALEVDWPRQDGSPRIAEILYHPRPPAQGGFYAVVHEIAGRQDGADR